MMKLTSEQRDLAIEKLKAYLAAPKGADGLTPVDFYVQRDADRVKVISGELKPLIEDFLAGGLVLADFKRRVDGINKRNDFWGFTGIKGQMFFNMLVNVAARAEVDAAKCEQELKSAISLPQNEETAGSRITQFLAYAKRLGEIHITSGGTKYECPKVGSVPYFLSYFWQIQDRKTWPVFYTSTINACSDMNLWQAIGDAAVDYLSYKKICEQLLVVYGRECSQIRDFYGVEHVMAFADASTIKATKSDLPVTASAPPIVDKMTDPLERLPESYVPPIVAILTRMSKNDPAIEAAAKASGTDISRAFEKNIHAAILILGFDAKLLGQGSGRVPDGIAIDQEAGYAIIWDAKVRGAGYEMGTDDRAIRDYISNQTRAIKKLNSLKNVYYMIVSSGFRDDFDHSIRTLKMETGINEVCLLNADALVELVDIKMRAPRDLSLGSDGLQRIFAVSGVITVEQVRKMFN